MSFPSRSIWMGRWPWLQGPAGGLGVVFAEAMAEAGADVVCADIAESVHKTARKIETLGKKSLALICDVSREEDVLAMMKSTVNAFGRLDILFNNAGIAEEAPKPLHEYTTQEWNRILSVDLQGVFYCAREALKIMVKQRSGEIGQCRLHLGAGGLVRSVPRPGLHRRQGRRRQSDARTRAGVRPLGHQRECPLPGFSPDQSRRRLRRPGVRQGGLRVHAHGKAGGAGGAEGCGDLSGLLGLRLHVRANARERRRRSGESTPTIEAPRSKLRGIFDLTRISYYFGFARLPRSKLRGMRSLFRFSIPSPPFRNTVRGPGLWCDLPPLL